MHHHPQQQDGSCKAPRSSTTSGAAPSGAQNFEPLPALAVVVVFRPIRIHWIVHMRAGLHLDSEHPPCFLTAASAPTTHAPAGVPCVGARPARPCHFHLPPGKPAPSSSRLLPTGSDWTPGRYWKLRILPHPTSLLLRCARDACHAAVLPGVYLISRWAVAVCASLLGSGASALCTSSSALRW